MGDSSDQVPIVVPEPNAFDLGGVMRIKSISGDWQRATLENEVEVSVAHQTFCLAESFGSGHDEECPCLNYELVLENTHNQGGVYHVN